MLQRFCAVALFLVATASMALAKAPLIVTVGDSTVCNFSLPDPRIGWGQVLPNYFTAGSATFNNQAESGASTKSFIDNGNWTAALALKPTYIFIQFGHNDQKNDDPTRYADYATTYQTNLTKMITDARAINAIPVLVTSCERRFFNANGTITHSLLTYSNAMKQVAAAQNVGLIDLNTMSGSLYESKGKIGCYYMSPDGLGTDSTHFSLAGANEMAKLVVSGIPSAAPGLTTMLAPEPVSASVVLAACLLLRRRKA